jgi:hypothetical protein
MPVLSIHFREIWNLACEARDRAIGEATKKPGAWPADATVAIVLAAAPRGGHATGKAAWKIHPLRKGKSSEGNRERNRIMGSRTGPMGESSECGHSQSPSCCLERTPGTFFSLGRPGQRRQPGRAAFDIVGPALRLGLMIESMLEPRVSMGSRETVPRIISLFPSGCRRQHSHPGSSKTRKAALTSSHRTPASKKA